MIDTDYLVIGAGASGLAFADALAAEADIEVTLIDRREVPGGHWADAYPFVRLHSPSAYYGVSTLALGENRIDPAGNNAGYYERATGGDVFGYFAEVARRLTQTGRVHVLTRHEHLGSGSEGERIRNLETGKVQELAVRRKVVDARYLEGSIPATHTPPFQVAAGARVVPVNDLPAAARSDCSYSILGSGKTAADACIWLLENDVEPGRIRWVRPRDAWFHDLRHFQPLEQVGATMEGLALDVEAGAHADSIETLLDRLEASGRLVRIDPAWPATMYRGTMLSASELELLRRIEDVVRLGRVRQVEVDRLVLERGEVQTGRDVVHVDCSALGLNNAPTRPIFQGDRIVIQQVRHLSPCFNAALIGFVEAHRQDDVEKNRLCLPHPYPSSIEDWPRMMSSSWMTAARCLAEPDVSAWVAKTRLNLLAALPDHAAEAPVQTAVKRYVDQLAAAIERVGQLDVRLRTDIGAPAATWSLAGS